jgi:hypothetical protein
MGGSQSFHDVPAVFDGPFVLLPAYPDVLTVDRADGTRRWRRPGWGRCSSGTGSGCGAAPTR